MTRQPIAWDVIIPAGSPRPYRIDPTRDINPPRDIAPVHDYRFDAAKLADLQALGRKVAADAGLDPRFRRGSIWGGPSGGRE